MTDRSRRLVTQGSGFALAVVVATALGVPSHALAASPLQNASPRTAAVATTTMCVTNVQPSPVVNRDGGDPLDPDVRHHWPDLDGGGPLDPLVRHHWP